MQPYELVQLKKQRQQQERVIKNWFGDFSVTSELTITEPKQMHAICAINPMAVLLFEKAQVKNEVVRLTYTKSHGCMNQFMLKTSFTRLYL